MANGPDELKFQNMVSLAMRLLAWIPSVKKKGNFILLKIWPRNDSNAKDDPYETPMFVYSKNMD
jgi:hypothetical protein